MSAATVWHCEKFLLRGKNAEIALTRLKNAKIDLYNVKKTENNAVTFEVKGKQARKVFAIYPKTWYNKIERGGFEVQSLGEKGIFPRLKSLKNRAGLLAGAAVFLLVTAFADNFTLNTVYTGDGALCKKAQRIVKESGINAFTRFTEAQAEELSAKILALDGAGYASVKKKGTVLYVEARRSPFGNAQPQKGDMLAKHKGTLKSLIVLRGSAAAKVGENIELGAPLVVATLKSGEGESEKYTQTTVVARAEISCEYQTETIAKNAAEAVAVAKFYLAEAENCGINSGINGGTIRTENAVAEKQGASYLVKIAYTAIETFNY